MATSQVNYNELSSEALVPGTEITGIEYLGDFDVMATNIGSLLLDTPEIINSGAEIVDPHETILRPIQLREKSTIGNNLATALRSKGVTNISKMGAVIVERTKPGSIWAVPGLSSNFVASVRLPEDYVASLDIRVYVERHQPKGQNDRARALKQTSPLSIRTQEEYLHWLQHTLLRPRMRKDDVPETWSKAS